MERRPDHRRYRKDGAGSDADDTDDTDEMGETDRRFMNPDADAHTPDAMPSLPSSSSPSQTLAAGATVFDFSGNFDSWSKDWRRRVLTPDSNPSVNYKVVDVSASIRSIAWIASRNVSFSTSDEAVVDSLAFGNANGDSSSVNKWLTTGTDAVSGNPSITIHVQSWLQKGAADLHEAAMNPVVMARDGLDDNSGSRAFYTAQPGDYMKLKIEWTRQEGPYRDGASTSGLFTVAEKADAAAVKTKWSQDIVQNFGQADENGDEGPASTETALPFGAGLITPTESWTLSIATEPPTVGGLPSSAPPSSSSSSSSSSPSSLSTGAIAGIAVGCVVAVVLLATTLLWYFFFSRCRQRHEHTPEKALDGAREHEYVAPDKGSAVVDDNKTSTANVANLAASPQHLPFSEDNLSQKRSPNAGPAAAGPSRHRKQHETSLAAAPAANFAERGMTDDERRRWEEEERQLDEEISRNRNRR